MKIIRQIKLSKYILLSFILITVLSPLMISCGSADTKDDSVVITKKPKGINFSVLTMGDLLVARDVEDIMRCVGLSYPFEKIEYELKQHDIVFANLETSITKRGNKHSWKAYTFRITPKNASYLRKMKIDVLNLANNHMLDFGRLGMSDTLKYIEKWGVQKFGAGWDMNDARKPAIKKMGKTPVVFLGYCERPPYDFFAGENKAGTAPLKLKYIVEDLKKYKKEGNLVFISLHWGIEYTSYPKDEQVEIAHKIIDAGADGIIGHHPHVPQGIEIYKGRPIIYSLGNAVNGYYEPTAQNNMMVAIHCKGALVTGLEILPLAGKNHEIHFQPFFLKNEEAIITLKHIRKISEPFETPIEIRNDRGFVKIEPYIVKKDKKKKGLKGKDKKSGDKESEESGDEKEVKKTDSDDDKKSDKIKKKSKKKKKKSKKSKKKKSKKKKKKK